MNCKRCGAEVSEDSHFCTRCGELFDRSNAGENVSMVTGKSVGPTIKSEANQNKEKDIKKWVLLVLIGVLVLGGLVGGVYYVQTQKQVEMSFKEQVDELRDVLEKYDLEDQAEYKSLLEECDLALNEHDKVLYKYLEGKVQETLESVNTVYELLQNMPQQLETYEASWANLYVTEDEKIQFEDLLAQLREATSEKEPEKIKSLSRNVEKIIEEITDKNKRNMEARVTEIEKQASSNMNQGEQKLAENLKADVMQFITQGNYARAQEGLNNWENFVKAFDVASDYTMEVEQIDTSEFPKVKLYLRVQNKLTGEGVSTLVENNFYLFEQTNQGDGYVRKEISKAIQLNEAENLNINIVADVSGSMEGMPLLTAKAVMQSFVSNIQFNIGDKASLTSFADQVYGNVGFTSDANTLINGINNLQTGDMTALYDALYMSINQIAMQEGAKCIIAFTDGMDNISNCSPSIVIELAKRYKIPVFIIGVGDSLNMGDLRNIAESTGGFYSNISTISSMKDIYEKIYRKQKEMYVLEYQTGSSENSDILREISIDYIDSQFVVKKDYEYIPAVYMEATVSKAQLFVNDFVIYDSDTRYLTAIDLQSLSQEQLRIARNEIYARRGRKFVDPELQNYFSSKSWYTPTIEANAFNESMFNDYEKANAYFIKDYERLKGYLK